uniref:Uncharacterized protein n=1 Tax=Romanomermis culicivorax TaxID=13658 RepID=A0A915HLP6_ROMCU
PEKDEDCYILLVLWSLAAIALIIIFCYYYFLFGVTRRHPIHIEPNQLSHQQFAKNELAVGEYKQELLFNGGVLGECRRQIGSFVDDHGGYARFVGISHYGSHGGREDHRGHQNEPYGSCGFDHNRCYHGGVRMRYTFAIEAERAGSHPKVAIVWQLMTDGPMAGLLAAGCGGNKFHRAEKSC